MNYLQLCQHVNMYGGFQGEISSVSATGYQALLVDAVRKAWVEIQKERADWDFLYTSADISLVSGTETYTGATNVGTWDQVVYNYKPLRFIPYKVWILIEPPSAGIPDCYTIEPATQSLIFSPLDDSYTVTGYYTQTPQLLVNNTDTPVLPVKHHHVIVYAAVLELAAYVSSSEIYQKNMVNYGKAMGQLMRDHVPPRKMRVRPFV